MALQTEGRISSFLFYQGKLATLPIMFSPAKAQPARDRKVEKEIKNYLTKDQNDLAKCTTSLQSGAKWNRQFKKSRSVRKNTKRKTVRLAF